MLAGVSCVWEMGVRLGMGVFISIVSFMVIQYNFTGDNMYVMHAENKSFIKRKVSFCAALSGVCAV